MSYQSSTWKTVAQVEIPASGFAIVEELLENRTPGPGKVLLVFVPVVNAKIPSSVYFTGKIVPAAETRFTTLTSTVLAPIPVTIP